MDATGWPWKLALLSSLWTILELIWRLKVGFYRPQPFVAWLLSFTCYEPNAGTLHKCTQEDCFYSLTSSCLILYTCGHERDWNLDSIICRGFWILARFGCSNLIFLALMRWWQHVIMAHEPLLHYSLAVRIKQACASGYDAISAQKEVRGNAGSSVPCMCMVVFTSEENCSHELYSRTCQAEKMKQHFGVSSMHIWGWLLMRRSVSPAPTSQGSSGREVWWEVELGRTAHPC